MGYLWWVGFGAKVDIVGDRIAIGVAADPGEVGGDVDIDAMVWR